MLNLKDVIDESLQKFNEDGYGDRLQDLYGEIPAGQCDGCLKCCMESVDTFYVEFLNIVQYLSNRPDLYKKLKKKILNYYFKEMLEKMPCPFLSDCGRCEIYEVRPLPCRVFGNLDREDYERNYEGVLASNQQVKAYFNDHFQIEIPEEVVKYKIEFCESFVPERVMTAEDRDDMVDLMFSMDSKFFMEELITEDYINTTLITWFAYFELGMDQAGKDRLTIMEELSKSQCSELLEQIFNNL